jgi:flavodoxin I
MSAKCLMVYASMTGNTEEMAQYICEGIRETGVIVELKDILTAEPADLLVYNGVLLGAYTWGDGDLPDEFLDFYDEMDGIKLKGIMAGAFGSCDSSYEHRGHAVDILIEKLSELGAETVPDGLKIDMAPAETEKELCREFGREFARKLTAG